MKSEVEKEAKAWPSSPVWSTARIAWGDIGGGGKECRKEGLTTNRAVAVLSNSTWEFCERNVTENWATKLQSCG